MKENELFKDYVLDLLHGCIQCDYLHTVITMDNNQVLGNVINVFKQRTGNSFSTHWWPKDFGWGGKDTLLWHQDACKLRVPQKGMFVMDYTVDAKVETRITNAAAKWNQHVVVVERESVEMRITNAAPKWN